LVVAVSESFARPRFETPVTVSREVALSLLETVNVNCAG